MSRKINAPIWCLPCGVSSEGGTYLAFIHDHAHCEPDDHDQRLREGLARWGCDE